MDIKQLIKECVKEQMERRIVREIVAEQLHKMWESGELNEAFFEASDLDEPRPDGIPQADGDEENYQDVIREISVDSLYCC